MNSGFGTINWGDVGKGFLIAFLTVAITELLSYLNVGTLPNWDQVWSLILVGLSAGVSYLLKNLFTNSSNKLLKKEPK